MSFHCIWKCGSQTSSNSITWELVRNAESQDPTPDLQNQKLHFNKIRQVILMHVNSWEALFIKEPKGKKLIWIKDFQVYLIGVPDIRKSHANLRISSSVISISNYGHHVQFIQSMNQGGKGNCCRLARKMHVLTRIKHVRIFTAQYLRDGYSLSSCFRL